MPGLDRRMLDQIDPSVAIRRIGRDVRTDFILAPHYNAIFLKASDELWGRAYEQLKSGKYYPELALTIAVPKPYGFTRPGSILHPVDRIVYQALADLAAPTLEAQLDRSRTFSHVLINPDVDGQMFQPEHNCWERLQARLRRLTRNGGCFVKADIASYFERIPQHHLVNLITASGCPPEVVNLLEEMFLAFQERDSFGIIQGVFPSDLFGNFYLSDIDAYCDIHAVPSVRFVDDIYLQFPSYATAARGLVLLIDQLRREGLHLNEFKSGIKSAEKLIHEETELDQLFTQTVKQIKDEKQATKQVKLSYGFPADWELEESDDDQDDEEVNAEAIERLYQSIDEYPKQSDKIERFCLPFLRAAESDVAVDRSLEGVVRRPHLARLYLSYLSRFAGDRVPVKLQLEKILTSNRLVLDYQRMYILGALMNSPQIKKETVNKTLQLLSNAQVCQEARGLAAIFAAKHGTPQQRRAVRLSYESEASAYVRGAILYAARHFTSTERKICIKAWGGHTVTNALISQALRAT